MKILKKNTTEKSKSTLSKLKKYFKQLLWYAWYLLGKIIINFTFDFNIDLTDLIS